MQLLVQTAAPDFPAWKSGFDSGADAIAAAGLTVLQMWKGEGGRALVLFSVANPARAREWLANQAATGADLSPQFLETA